MPLSGAKIPEVVPPALGRTGGADGEQLVAIVTALGAI